MFGKLKDTLKKSLSIFSRKTQEESEDIPVEKVEEVLEKETKQKAQEKVETKTDQKNVSQATTEKTNVEEPVIEKEVKQEVVEKISIKETPVEKVIITKETKPQIIEEKEEPIVQEIEKKSFFGKLKHKLTTKTISSEKFEELFWDIEVALLENNVSIQVIEKIKENLKIELVDKALPRDVLGKINEVLEETLKEVLNIAPIDIIKKIKEKQDKPFVIAFFGINGSGKTTTIAKLANYLKKQNISVVLAACDTFRAAAIDQLEVHANKLDVKMIKHDYGSDSAAVAFDAIKYAQKNKTEVVLIDTAGRLHSNTNLMAELEKLLRVNRPDLKIFIGESITGNDCVEQAEKFNASLGVDGIILTKADIDEMGGAPLSVAYVLGKPILFLGMGQRYEDFEVFNPTKILERLGF
jgi:fused signal recognition particle receptor